jgi:signal transduction histidine kinase
MTSARRKVLRAAGKQSTTIAEVNAAIAHARLATDQLEAELRKTKDVLIAEYKETKEYQTEIAEALRPDIQKALGQVHDYKQFVQQVIQNINVILGKRFPNLTIEEQLDAASHEEVAIYWAARLMEEKLDAALYVMYPDRIHELRDRRRFRFHGAVTKYRKIYQRRLEESGLELVLSGESHGDVESNPRAITVIPHALIDNAIKYAPEKSKIELSFQETDHIDFSVASYGPIIYEDERDKIFDLFYRGRDAARRDSEGTGFGLASAQIIAKSLGTEIEVRQEPKAGPQDCRWTTFSVRFELALEKEERPNRTLPRRR